MYGTRQASFRQQIHQRDRDLETDSVAPIDPDEETINTPMYKKIIFKQSKDLPVLKKAQYKRFPEAVRKQMRRILNDNYKLALNHIAGAEAGGNANYELDAALTHIAKHVDKSLKTHTIPGNFDTNLLNSTLSDAIIEAKEKFSCQTKQIAKEVILLERKQHIVEQEKEDADKSSIIKEKKAMLESLSMRQESEPISIDYIQSLLQYPSSSIFEPLS